MLKGPTLGVDAQRMGAQPAIEDLASRLAEAEERMSILLESLEEGVVYQDRDGVILTANASAQRILGLTLDQMCGRDSLDPRWRSVHEDGSEFPGEEHPASVALATGEPQLGVIMGVHKPDALLSWISINARPILSADEVHGVVCSFTDVTDRKRNEDRLAHRALHDPLTNLPNRTLFRDRVEQAIRRGTRTGGKLAVLFVDLDGFKAVNDRFGHAAGDLVLAESARRLLHAVRSGDTVARLGGDEFGVLCEGLDGAGAAGDLALDMVSALAEPHDLPNDPCRIQASAGVSLGRPGPLSVDMLLDEADSAMYDAKRAGGGRFSVFG